MDPGIYVPRWQSLELAARAAARLPESGRAIDLCTGSGAIAASLQARRPAAHVIATDIDPGAVACARSNGVEARRGDLFDPVPAAFEGTTDVVVAVVPYVPTTALHLLPHDVRHEAATHYHGGFDGTDVLRRVIEGAPKFLTVRRRAPSRARRRPGRDRGAAAGGLRVHGDRGVGRRGR